METVSEYLTRLMLSRYPNIEPLSDELGICTQIDNMLCGMDKELSKAHQTMAFLDARNASDLDVMEGMSREISRNRAKVESLKKESAQWQEAAGQSLVRAETAEDQTEKLERERDQARRRAESLWNDLSLYMSQGEHLEPLEWGMNGTPEPKP